MPPKKEIHFFDRSPYYLSPNTLAVSSPLLRLLRSERWDIRDRIKDLLRLVKYTFIGDAERADWYRKWSFGYCDDSWYQALFNSAKSHQICGEITPSYSMLESQDIARIKALNPDIKLIFMLRDPIDRAWSAIRFGSGRGRLNVDLASPDEIIDTLKQPGVVLRGDYERTLDNYLQQFDSSQLLVCFYEAIRQDPVGLMTDIADFLDISPFAEGSINASKRVNASKPRPMPKPVRDYLLETYGPSIERIASSLGSYANVWKSLHSPVTVGRSNYGSDYTIPPSVHP